MDGRLISHREKVARKFFHRIDDGLFRIGRWEFGLFDDGWLIAREWIIKAEGKWPTWKTFHRKTK